MVASSALLNTFSAGKYIIISDGASVPCASISSISTPSMFSVSRSFSINRVGGISVTVPTASALPMPESTVPRAPRSRKAPNWYCARRLIALPASTFSAIACSMNPAGAITATLPALTSSSLTTPLTPPK
ncbi:hypothetical protein D9M72_508380 [compost metagenome]